jgi:hypothetical protein
MKPKICGVPWCSNTAARDGVCRICRDVAGRRLQPLAAEVCSAKYLFALRIKMLATVRCRHDSRSSN